MSENKDTGPAPIEATVGINTNGCFAATDDHMLGVSTLRAKYRPAETITWTAMFKSHVPATVTVRIGQTSITLTPEVWAAVNDAVQQVLPVDVVPA